MLAIGSRDDLADRAVGDALPDDLDSDNSEDREVMRLEAWAQAELTYGLFRPVSDGIIRPRVS